MTRDERRQRRFERELIEIDRAVFMKPLDMSKEWHNYMEGKVIPAQELTTPAGLRLFGEIIWEDHRKDRATAQYGFDNELYWQKVHPTPPELTPEQQHLAEVRPLKQGITMTITERFDSALEGVRIEEIKTELANMI